MSSKTNKGFRNRPLVIAIALSWISLFAMPVFGQRTAVSQAYQLTHTIKYDPSPSPDGKKLVYIGVVQGREQLFIMNVDGTGSFQITHDDVDHEDPAWSPDGLQHLTPRNSRTIHPNWSPDGSKLAYCTDDDLAPPRKNDSDILVIDIASRRITTLVTGRR